MKNKILRDYIKEQNKKGHSYDKIKSHLLSHSYKEHDVDDNVKSLKAKKRVLIIGAGIIILFLAIYVAILYLYFDESKEELPDIRIEKEKATVDELQKEIVKKIKRPDYVYVGELYPEKNVYFVADTVFIDYTIENLKPVYIDGVYKTAVIFETIIISPNGDILDKKSPLEDDVMIGEYENEARISTERFFYIEFNETDPKGKYNIIALFTDIYNNENTVAKAEIELR